MALAETVITEIAKRLVGLVIPSLSEAAPEKLNELKRSFQQPAQQYVQTYLKRHGNIQILGMSRPISLDEIYTRVVMLDPETIIGFETIEGLEQAYRKAKKRGFNLKNTKTESGMDVANSEQYLCVLGGPGIGKTTYLRKIGLEALLSRDGQYQHKLIPVFLELKNLTIPDLNLKDEITHEFDICGFPDASKFTDKALKTGNLLILLDGLDEVPTDKVNRAIRAITDLSDQYAKNRYMVSCRIAAYHSYFKGFRNVAIAEFTQEQMSQFISNWFLADPNPEITVEQKITNGSNCWQQLQDSTSVPTMELSHNPLLLTFICLVYRNMQTITDNRALLYAQALKILLVEWYKEKSLEESWGIYQYLPPKLERELLAEIAYLGFEEDKLFFKKGDLAQQISTFLEDRPKAPKDLDSDVVIDAISEQQGIVLERAKGVYSFSHLTLQEYLCAEYVLQWNYQDRLVTNHVLDERWREVFFLVTGMMGRTAIGFLKKLEEQTQAFFDYPKLQGLFAWINTTTAHSDSKYPNETKRIFALLLILALARARTRPSNPDYVNSHTRTRASTLDRAILLARTLASTLDNTLAKDYDHTLEQARDLALASVTASFCAKFSLDKKLISGVDLKKLILYLDNSSTPTQVSSEQFISKISSLINISPEYLDPSKDDVQIIINYLVSCQLMLDCSKQASDMSAQQWKVIKQRLFLSKPVGIIQKVIKAICSLKILKGYDNDS